MCPTRTSAKALSEKSGVRVPEPGSVTALAGYLIKKRKRRIGIWKAEELRLCREACQ
jgi:hypothetical protein